MEACEELSDFDKGQVVMAREMGVSVSETARMVGCSRAAVVSAYRQWYEEGLRLRAGRPKVIDPKELEDESEEAGGGRGGAAEEETSPEDSQEKPEEGEST